MEPTASIPVSTTASPHCAKELRGSGRALAKTEPPTFKPKPVNIGAIDIDEDILIPPNKFSNYSPDFKIVAVMASLNEMF
jgi:hypothetical protein